MKKVILAVILMLLVARIAWWVHDLAGGGHIAIVSGFAVINLTST